MSLPMPVEVVAKIRFTVYLRSNEINEKFLTQTGVHPAVAAVGQFVFELPEELDFSELEVEGCDLSGSHAYAWGCETGLAEENTEAD